MLPNILQILVWAWKPNQGLYTIWGKEKPKYKVVTISKQAEKIHKKGLGSQDKHKTMDNKESCWGSKEGRQERGWKEEHV